MNPMQRLICALLLINVALSAESTIIREWSFDKADADGWRPGRHLPEIIVADGVLTGTPDGHDPQLISPPLNLNATMWQEIHIRMRCEQEGQGEIFFTNTFDEPYGGFRSDWTLPYNYNGRNDWQVIKIRPFWEKLGTIRQLRVDPPREGTTDIDWIRIVTVDPGESVTQSSWQAVDGALPGWTHDGNGFLTAPPLRLPVTDLPWLHLDITSTTEAHGTVKWVTDQAAKLQTREFFLARDGRRHTYRLDMGIDRAWHGNLVYLAVRLTGKHDTQPIIHQVRLAAAPPRPADVRIEYFGPENAVNRVGTPCSLLLRLVNAGGTPARVRVIRPELPAAQWMLSNQGRPDADDAILEPDIPWTQSLYLRPLKVGPLQGTVKLLINDRPITLTAETMQVHSPAADLPTEQIPEPIPAKTSYRIGAYYYPGFGRPYQWRQLERTAPWAKPVLGYYDEGNPECIDWQIKWAVEHGISFFLIDWYWVAGEKRHMHYLEGLAKARFRHHLKWAVMWANHNPPNTHSKEDWRQVVQYWIEHYLQTPEYLTIDGKPAVFIWAPNNIRQDLGGSEAASELYAMAQDMARKAGLSGITFVAMRKTQSEDLHSEGYTHVTSYHWWADALAQAANPRYLPYSLIVERGPHGWTQRETALEEQSLDFLPLVDTGWDARPRHGSNTRVIYDRTPELFERSLADARQWLDERQQDTLILGPINEWTEGSYIEPCTEFGFKMYQAIHRVFCEGPLPEIVTPQDVDLGPYDFDLTTPGAVSDSWRFTDTLETCGWRPLMGLKDVAVESGALTGLSTTHDPAFISDRLALQTSTYTSISISLQILPAPQNGDQLLVFWGTETSPINSRAYVKVPLSTDRETHEYTLELADHPRWRGLLRYLRIDPCLTANKAVRITSIRLLP